MGVVVVVEEVVVVDEVIGEEVVVKKVVVVEGSTGVVVTVVMVVVGVVVSHAHISVHDCPALQPFPLSHCSPERASTTPSPHTERIAVNFLRGTPFARNLPRMMLHSGLMILAISRTALKLPHDGHVPVTLVKVRRARICARMESHAALIEMRVSELITTAALSKPASTRGLLEGFMRKTPAGQGAGLVLLDHTSKFDASRARTTTSAP